MSRPFPTLPDVHSLKRTLQRATSAAIAGTIHSVGRNALQVVCLPVPMDRFAKSSAASADRW